MCLLWYVETRTKVDYPPSACLFQCLFFQHRQLHIDTIPAGHCGYLCLGCATPNISCRWLSSTRYHILIRLFWASFLFLTEDQTEVPLVSGQDVFSQNWVLYTCQNPIAKLCSCSTSFGCFAWEFLVFSQKSSPAIPAYTYRRCCPAVPLLRAPAMCNPVPLARTPEENIRHRIRWEFLQGNLFTPLHGSVFGQ